MHGIPAQIFRHVTQAQLPSNEGEEECAGLDWVFTDVLLQQSSCGLDLESRYLCQEKKEASCACKW